MVQHRVPEMPNLGTYGQRSRDGPFRLVAQAALLPLPAPHAANSAAAPTRNGLLNKLPAGCQPFTCAIWQVSLRAEPPTEVLENPASCTAPAKRTGRLTATMSQRCCSG